MSHKLEGSGANGSIGRLTATTLCRTFCMALLAVGLTVAQLQAATWTWNDVSGAGNWSDTTKWTPLGSYPNAQAAVADFSQVDLTADETVTLDAGLSPGYVTLGSLIFGNTDASPAANWILAAASSANYIQLDNTGGTGARRSRSTTWAPVKAPRFTHSYPAPDLPSLAPAPWPLPAPATIIRARPRCRPGLWT